MSGISKYVILLFDGKIWKGAFNTIGELLEFIEKSSDASFIFSESDVRNLTREGEFIARRKFKKGRGYVTGGIIHMHGTDSTTAPVNAKLVRTLTMSLMAPY